MRKQKIEWTELYVTLDIDLGNNTGTSRLFRMTGADFASYANSKFSPADNEKRMISDLVDILLEIEPVPVPREQLIKAARLRVYNSITDVRA